MKFLAFILSIYIFALNLAPCEDTAMFDNEVKTEVSHDMGDNHEHQDADLCSPFCSCQCCHINVMHFKFVSIKFNLPYISTQDFFYRNGTEKDFATSILQPPRA